MKKCQTVEKLTKLNIEKNGEICENCSMSASWCRCHNNTEKAKNCDGHDFRVFQSGYGQCKKCKTVQKV